LEKNPESIASETAVGFRKDEFERLAASYGFECVLEEVVSLPSQDLRGRPCVLECIVRRFQKRERNQISKRGR